MGGWYCGRACVLGTDGGQGGDGGRLQIKECVIAAALRGWGWGRVEAAAMLSAQKTSGTQASGAAAQGKVKARNAEVQEIHRAFDVIDKDESGEVDRHEVRPCALSPWRCGYESRDVSLTGPATCSSRSFVQNWATR